MAARRKTFVEVEDASGFPLENLPFGVFESPNNLHGGVGSRIGEFVVDLYTLAERAPEVFTSEALDAETARTVFSKSQLNEFMELGRPAWVETRRVLTEILAEDGSLPQLRSTPDLAAKVLLPINFVRMLLPAKIGDYTDFYASKYHAENIGTMLRGKDNALMPNWVHLPVGYHGRSSSVVVSGTSVRRPRGQTVASNEPDARPSHGPCRLLDFELEIAFLMGGPPNKLGQPIPISEARKKWEYVPLGPFLSKNFATTISPWVVTLEALEYCRIPAGVQDPKPLEYLDDSSARTTFDITLQASIRSSSMIDAKGVCTTNYKHLYWTIEQMIAHHSCTGCPMNPGDLLASGTVSGPDPESYASMMEISWRGTKPFSLGEQNGERKFLEDGDTVIITGSSKQGEVTIGFGECIGTVLPAVQ